ncbi:MAG TPA: hypothetical protein V6C86_25455 [Oculatellaceae cyanobacterium]
MRFVERKWTREKARKRRGSATVELPVALWILVFVFLFPLIDLATIGLRTSFLYAALHQATWEAARAHTFQNSLDSQKPAVQLANDTANSIVKQFNGIALTSIQTKILTTNIATSAVTSQSTPLSAPADQSQNIYQIQVTLKGSITPLVLWHEKLAAIPGMTAPLSIQLCDSQYCENTQGLNK